MGQPRAWTGSEWQDYCLELLRLHYPVGDLVVVPDRHGGDAGLEAFTTSGVAYQCYAPEVELTVNQRYISQRNKMTEDLRKFCNTERMAPVLGSTIIQRWVLLTPDHDSRKLVEHASTKAQFVREKLLPYVASDFVVVTLTDDDFFEERRRIYQGGVRELDYEYSLADAELHNFATAQSELLDNLDRKLAKDSQLTTSGRAAMRGSLLARYLEGANTLSYLGEDYPDLSTSANRVITHTESRLPLEYNVMSGRPTVVMKTLSSDLSQRLATRLTAARTEMLETLAWAAVGDWLMRCPLDFDGYP